MKNNGDLTVLNFIAECNEFIEGKFLFASQKLEGLYKHILDSPLLVELFLQCSEDFKYSLEMTKAFIKTPTKPGTFTPPKEADKFLALVFGLLKEIDEKTINFNVFVPKYFSEDAKVPPTQAFANQIIVPLKSTVAKYFEMDENNKEHFSKQQIEEEKQKLIEIEATEQQQRLQEKKLQEENQEGFEADIDLNKEINLEDEGFKKQEFESQEDVKIISNLEENKKVYQVTYNDLMEALKILLDEMLNDLRQNAKIKQTIKTDAIFVFSRALGFAKNNDMENLYSEFISIKYMKKYLRPLKLKLKELFEIFEYFEKL